YDDEQRVSFHMNLSSHLLPVFDAVAVIKDLRFRIDSILTPPFSFFRSAIFQTNKQRPAPH
ncbi:MAG: hypothetical protein PVG11_01300, partial [Anaerolineae bacterium]